MDARDARGARTLLFVAPAVGFVGFLSNARRGGQTRRNADGIVVLTGGRVAGVDAMELLAAGYGKRLIDHRA